MKDIGTRLHTCLLLAVAMLWAAAVHADGYRLEITALPSVAGSFNTRSATLEAGQTIHLYAYSNSNFSFVQWKDADGNVVSRQMDFTYTMPSHDSRLTAEYAYNPANPANPARNYWNKNLGEVIIDDFTTGSLQNAVKTAIGNSSSSDVSMITVAGIVNGNDLGIINTYSNCQLLDLCRVSGITNVPSYAFDYTKLEVAYLPASVERIGYRAFYQCSQLSSLILYAMTPPALESDVFTGVPEDMVVYVPAAAIARYQDASVWKGFTILPIQEDIRSLSVSLPEGATPRDYTQMWLELTNVRSGQRMHYVMTDRTQYTFSNIIRNTVWNVVLRNERGDVFGHIDGVEVRDEDVTVGFTGLSKPQRLYLVVMTPDGTVVTEKTQVTWTDANGSYLAQGYSISGLPVGAHVSSRIDLSQDLAMQYVVPRAAEYVLADGGNDVVCQLEPIGHIRLTGKVRDASTGLPLSGATVSSSQTFGGKYGKTVNARTDRNGAFALDVASVPTSLAVAASDYVSQTLDYTDGSLDGTDAISVPDVLLRPITGAAVTVGFTFTDVNGNMKKWYNDCQNIDYRLFNVTRNQSVTQFSVQYPQIVLLEEIGDGDVLRLTAKSRTGAFMPVETQTSVSGQKAAVTFDIVEPGKIVSTFTMTGNASVVGSLYDASGKLIKSYAYSEARLTISDLPDGRYTLVTMGDSRLFNTIYDMAQLSRTGLAEGTDYVSNTVEVRSGRVSTIDIAEVPRLDESKLYYTGANTSLTVNKPSIVVGNYLTVTGRIDFKAAYAAGVGNVSMIVDLPESCQFVENSVMVGNSTGSYTLNGNQLAIPMARYTDRVRFCVIPTLGGEYAPSAFVRFDLDGETLNQPIGSATYTARNLSISVPSTVAKTTIPVCGTAIGASSVEIYDNGVLIGQTTSKANGTWATTCELNDAYNLSTHNIQARVRTRQEVELVSDVQPVFYDRNHVSLKNVLMTFYNAYIRQNVNVTFDFEKGTTTPSSYMFYTGTNVSFVTDLTTNSPDVVSGVVVNVYTDKNEVRKLRAEYDVTLDRWVANSRFESNNLPVNVSVDYDADSKIECDTLRAIEPFLNYYAEMDSLQIGEIDSLGAEIRNGIADSQLSSDEIDTKMSALAELVGCNRNGVQMSETEKGLLEALKNVESEEEFRNVWSRITEQLPVDDNLTKWNAIDLRVDDGEYRENDSPSAPGVIGRKGDGTIQDSEKGKVENASGWVRSPESNEITNPVTGDKIKIDLGDLVPSVGETADDLQGFVETVDGIVDRYGTAAGLALDVAGSLVDESLRNAQVRDICLYEAIQYLQQKGNYGPVRSIMYMDMEENLRNMARLRRAQAGLQVAASGLHYVSTAFQTRNDLHNAYNSFNDWTDLIGNLYVVCSYDEAQKIEQKAREYQNLDRAKRIGIGVSNAALAVGQAFSLIAAPASLGASLGVSVGLTLASWGVSALNRRFDQDNRRHMNEILNMVNGSAKCGDPKKMSPSAGQTTLPAATPIHDPSGYVYEAVSSNRIEGVTATAYYKETVEDMYGDLHENVAKWDASEYAQENPLFTDENGMYAWDVPQGLWQVKFEKEGYETTYSDWLPVPPPQLDVNIAMKQNRQPEVKSARAFEDAVEIEFDKYMMPDLLTVDNIAVRQNGNPVEGSIELLNAETAYNDENLRYASRLRFNASQPFDAENVTLLISNKVKSYAGIRMQDDYEQEFVIGQEIKRIESEPLAVVGYGDTRAISVSAYPVAAAKGKTMHVSSSSPMILKVENEQVVLDDNGKALILMSGNLPGTAALTFTVDGTDKVAETVVNVEPIASITVKTPTSSIASGSTVDRGTEIMLSCATEGATIYYTLDGSCPCDDNGSRKIFDGRPIVVDRSMTVKVIATASLMYDSDVAEFHYEVSEDTGIEAVTESSGSSVHSPSIYTLSGTRLRKIRRSGLYIIDGEKRYVKVK